MDRQNELAWAAGVFEGEGCISTSGKSTVVVKVDMTDKDVVERLHRIFGGYFYELTNLNKDKGWKDNYRWTVSSSREAINVLVLIAPYLGERRLAKGNAAVKHYVDGMEWKREISKLRKAVEELWHEGLTEQRIADKLGIKRSRVSMFKSDLGLTKVRVTQ